MDLISINNLVFRIWLECVKFLLIRPLSDPYEDYVYHLFLLAIGCMFITISSLDPISSVLSHLRPRPFQPHKVESRLDPPGKDGLQSLLGLNHGSVSTPPVVGGA